MKFGKDFKKEMVPEWAEAYMDYNDLKRILRELREYKQSKLRLAVTPSRAFEQKPPLEGILSEGGDVEDQVIDVNTLRGVGSKKFYKTKFLRQSEEGGEIEVTFFRELDEELNKVNTFYKDKLEEVRQEASQLNKQMDALVALRIKVKNPHQDGSSSGRVDNVDSTMPLTKNTSAADTSGVEFRGLESGVKANDKDQQEPYPGASDADPAHAKITRSDSREVLHTYNYNQDPLEVLRFSSRRASRSYMQIVDNSALGNPDEVTNLMERVEATFINNFSHSNRRKGMKLLRPKAKIEKHKVSFLSGFFSGCSIALLVAIVLRIQSRKLMNKKEGTQYMEDIFPLYSLFGYVVLHLLMYAADIYFWRRCRINYLVLV
ncbi:hypothetical protein ACLB2K_042936 [Fragaria x ananassa]